MREILTRRKEKERKTKYKHKMIFQIPIAKIKIMILSHISPLVKCNKFMLYFMAIGCIEKTYNS